MSKVIVFVGGGTGGAVSPLLAVAESIRKSQNEKFKIIFLGGRGIEAEMAGRAGLEYVRIPAGKLRRYGSPRNLLTPFWVTAGFVKSLLVLRKLRPLAVFGVGSFVQVPVAWAAWFLRIPVVLHQQDVVPSLSNTLCSWIAQRITVSLKASEKEFSHGLWLPTPNTPDKVVFTGNPCRLRKSDLPSKEEAIRQLNLRRKFPTLLVMGGGTGAEALNKLVSNNLGELLKYVNVVHLTGKGKTSFHAGRDLALREIPNPLSLAKSKSRQGEKSKINFAAEEAANTDGEKAYIQKEFASDMSLYYAVSDLVLCRAGLSTITELSILGKVAIVVPMPNSHQVENARLLDREKCAVVLNQDKLTGEMLVWTVRRLLHSEAYSAFAMLIERLMPKDGAEKVAEVLMQVAIEQ